MGEGRLRPGPASLRELVEEFSRRRDVSPQAFGFIVEETIEQLRRAGILDEDHFEHS
jgi:hypothetical protein